MTIKTSGNKPTQKKRSSIGSTHVTKKRPIKQNVFGGETPETKHAWGFPISEDGKPDENGKPVWRLQNVRDLYVNGGNQEIKEDEFASSTYRTKTIPLYNQCVKNNEEYGKFCSNYELNEIKKSIQDHNNNPVLVEAFGLKPDIHTVIHHSQKSRNTKNNRYANSAANLEAFI